MPIATSDILGSDQVGIYLSVCGNVVFHPHELSDEALNRIDECLGLERHPLSIGGSTLVGALVTGTSKGLAVADIATAEDVDTLTAFGDVVVMEGGVNTAGNLILCNEFGAIASPAIPEDGVEIISQVLGVPTVVLLHPDVMPEEVMLIEEVLGVAPMVGTVSFGSPYVGAGLAASNNGVIAGRDTTGPELNRIEDALGLI